MFEFKLPDLGEGVHEGEILHWHVNPGDQVSADDPLVEVETDKAAVTIPSPRAGTVVSVKGGVGETVAVGSVLVVIDETDGAGAPAKAAEAEPSAPAQPAASPEPAQPAVSPQPAQPVRTSETAGDRSSRNVERADAGGTAPVRAGEQKPAEVSRVTPPRGDGPVPAAPATRRKARELGIDLRRVEGSGPAGRVTTEDLLRFAERAAGAVSLGAEARSDRGDGGQGGALRDRASAPASAADPAETPSIASAEHGPAGAGIPFFEVERLPDFAELGPVEREPLRSIRRKVAHKMVASMTIVPHVAHMDEADVTELERFRREQNARRSDVKLTLLSFVIKAVVAQLRRMPKLNASIDPHRQEIVFKKYYNIGFAADTPKGLVVPVITGADRLSLVEIGHSVQGLAEKARAGTLDVSELRGGTFTITNVGSLGGTHVIPTINYPEVGILGLGRANEKAVVREGKIVVRTILPMTLSFDHRLVDGADAARFVSALVERLSDPNRLLLES